MSGTGSFLLICSDCSSSFCLTNVKKFTFTWNCIYSSRFVDGFYGRASFEEMIGKSRCAGEDGFDVEFFVEGSE